MKILMMASTSGVGLTYHLARLSIGLKRKGYDVTVLSGPKEQVTGLSNELKETGVRHYKSYHVDRMTACDIYRSKNDIKGILELEDVDVIHAQGATDALEAYLATRSLPPDERPSIVTSVHSIPKMSNTALAVLRPKWAAMTMILNVCSDVILPVSNNTREQLIRHGAISKKTVLVHNAIDLKAFDDGAKRAKISLQYEKSDEPAIVYVANLIANKGHEYYLVAAKRVLEKYRTKFYVIGDGPRRAYLEKLAQCLGIEKNVVFSGSIWWPEVYFVLSNLSDICVSASISENFPYYVLECMLAGRPIVAASVGGIPEAIRHGKTGYLVPPRDPVSMSRAIIELLEAPDRARKMGTEARKMAQQEFSMKKLVGKLGRIYEFVDRKC